MPVRGKVFTRERATEMLPLLRTILRDALQLSQAIDRQRDQIAGIDKLAETMDHPSYRDEVNDIRVTLQDEEARLEQCIIELTELGVEPHLPLNGNIDFPAIVNRQPACLCWALGENSVDFWHNVGQDAAFRRPLPPKTIGTEKCL
ncbi:DUF2203 domain-containing protein [Novipirellula sp. SH528]|uniref:DUF2203 domain-containing protein n=1 Tax=Novipirellula sp. SH528 TaxID=3454466 RepID=UPI003F9F85F2